MLPETGGGRYEFTRLPAHWTLLDSSMLDLAFLITPLSNALNNLSIYQMNGV